MSIFRSKKGEKYKVGSKVFDQIADADKHYFRYTKSGRAQSKAMDAFFNQPKSKALSKAKK